jgi:hypothetical protein
MALAHGSAVGTVLAVTTDATRDRLPTEFEVLLLLSRLRVGEEQVARVRALLSDTGRPPDWARLVDQAAQHRVAAMVAGQLRQHFGADYASGDFSLVDPSSLSLLRAFQLHHGRRNEVLGRELDQILLAATTATVPVVVRKGGYFAFAVYPDPAWRPMGDLDLLVTRNTAPALVSLLRDLGYAEGTALEREAIDEPMGAVRPPSRREKLFWHMYGSDLPKLCKATDDPDRPVVSVDINVSLTLPGTGSHVPTEDLLDRAVVEPVRGNRAKVLGPEDTVIDLCLHIHKNSTVLRFMRAGKHRRLLKYVDFVAYLDQCAGQLRWPVVLDRAIEHRIEAPMYYTLAHLDRLYPGHAPPEVLDELAARCPDSAVFLDQYGQWDRQPPLWWAEDFLVRFFDRKSDHEVPPSRSLV